MSSVELSNTRVFANNAKSCISSYQSGRRKKEKGGTIKVRAQSRFFSTVFDRCCQQHRARLSFGCLLPTRVDLLRIDSASVDPRAKVAGEILQRTAHFPSQSKRPFLPKNIFAPIQTRQVLGSARIGPRDPSTASRGACNLLRVHDAEPSRWDEKLVSQSTYLPNDV